MENRIFKFKEARERVLETRTIAGMNAIEKEYQFFLKDYGLKDTKSNLERFSELFIKAKEEDV